jgi:cytochrome c
MSFALGLSAQANAQDASAGQSLFQDRCSMCHVLGGQGMGPDLIGVVGRKAASLPNFNYTPALTSSGLTWTRATLDGFLTDPRGLVPGTAMRVKLPAASDRADLIAYLATLGKR